MGGRISTKSLYSWLLPLLILFAFIFQQIWGVELETSMELSNNPETILYHPWSLFTYSLLHSSYLHFGINMGLMLLILWGDKLSTEEVYALFSISAIIGGAIFVILPGPEASIIGASAGITALMAASIYRIFIHNNLWIIALPGIVLLDLLTQGLSFSLGFTVHLSGYLIGLIYALYSSKRFIDKRDQKKDEEGYVAEIISKAKTSGYQSLSNEEQEKLITSVEK